MGLFSKNNINKKLKLLKDNKVFISDTNSRRKWFGQFYNFNKKEIIISNLKPKSTISKINKQTIYHFKIVNNNILYTFKTCLVSARKENIIFQTPKNIEKFNRRNHKRHIINNEIKVIFNTEYNKYIGIITDLSFGGIGINLTNSQHKKLPKNIGKVNFKFKLQGNKVMGTGRLIKRKFMIGMKFIKIDNISKEILNNYILKLRKNQIKETSPKESTININKDNNDESRYKDDRIIYLCDIQDIYLKSNISNILNDYYIDTLDSLDNHKNPLIYLIEKTDYKYTLALLKKIKLQNKDRNIPIILFTKNYSKNFIIKAAQIGVNEIINIPINYKKLKNKLINNLTTS